MDLSKEWRLFDPKDERTHPLGMPKVEFEYENGMKRTGIYGIGLFTVIGGAPHDAKPKRWRYVDDADE